MYKIKKVEKDYYLIPIELETEFEANRFCLEAEFEHCSDEDLINDCELIIQKFNKCKLVNMDKLLINVNVTLVDGDLIEFKLSNVFLNGKNNI